MPSIAVYIPGRSIVGAIGSLESKQIKHFFVKAPSALAPHLLEGMEAVCRVAGKVTGNVNCTADRFAIAKTIQTVILHPEGPHEPIPGTEKEKLNRTYVHGMERNTESMEAEERVQHAGSGSSNHR